MAGRSGAGKLCVLRAIVAVAMLPPLEGVGVALQWLRSGAAVAPQWRRHDLSGAAHRALSPGLPSVRESRRARRPHAKVSCYLFCRGLCTPVLRQLT